MKFFVVAVVIAVGLVSSAMAVQFENIGIYRTQTLQYSFGARAQSMGGAMASAWGSPGSVRWNPAAPVAASGFAMETSYEETRHDWEHWNHAVSADAGNVTIMLLVDDWRQEQQINVAPGFKSSTYIMNNRTGWIGASWRARTWQGNTDRKTLVLGGGTHRFRSTINADGFHVDDCDVGAVFSWERVPPGGFGLIQLDLGAARTNILNNRFDDDVREVAVPAAVRFGGRAVWQVTQELQGTTTLDWERWRADGNWLEESVLTVGIEMLWMDLFAFRYGVGQQEDISPYSGRAFGAGFRYALVNDRLILRVDVATIDMNENLGFDTTEVWTIGAGWRP